MDCGDEDEEEEDVEEAEEGRALVSSLVSGDSSIVTAVWSETSRAGWLRHNPACAYDALFCFLGDAIRCLLFLILGCLLRTIGIAGRGHTIFSSESEDNQ